MDVTIGMTLDCVDVATAAAFWKEALGYDEPAPVTEGAQFHALVSPGGGLHHLTLQQVSETKSVKNRAHLDLFVDDLDREVARLQDLGAAIDTEHDHPDEEFRSTVMTDPDGNEFCVVQRHVDPD